MMNSLPTYRDAGTKAGHARKHRDEAGARFHSDWFRRALRLEDAADRPACQAAFDAAYRAETQAGLPTPLP